MDDYKIKIELIILAFYPSLYLPMYLEATKEEEVSNLSFYSSFYLFLLYLSTITSCPVVRVAVQQEQLPVRLLRPPPRLLSHSQLAAE